MQRLLIILLIVLIIIVAFGSICRDGWFSSSSGSGSCAYHGGLSGSVDIKKFNRKAPFKNFHINTFFRNHHHKALVWTEGSINQNIADPKFLAWVKTIFNNQTTV